MKQLPDKYLRILIVLALLSVALNMVAFTTAYIEHRSKLDSNVLAVGTLALTVTPEGFCDIDLLEDWNLISICASPSDTSIDSVTSTISDSFDYILKWNASSQSYLLWSSFTEDNPFDNLEVNSSYFFHVNRSSKNFPIEGTANQNFNISLIENFNSPSWPYEFNKSIAQALGSVNNSYTYVLKWNASSQSFLLFSVFASENPFQNISAGEGQFINVNTSSIVLQYNRSDLAP